MESTVRLYVCTGVDCSGHGSGAALLEIEELCQELAFVSGHGQRPNVIPSVCTLQCANAPVINMQHLDAHGHSTTEHHCKVDGPHRCAQVVDAVRVRSNRQSAHHCSDAAPKGPMLRRADGMRWDALRQQERLSRHQQQHDPSLLRSAAPSRLLVLALQAELSAAKDDPSRRARAERRAARLSAGGESG